MFSLLFAFLFWQFPSIDTLRAYDSINAMHRAQMWEKGILPYWGLR